MKWDAPLGLQTAAGVLLAVVASLKLGLEDPWWSAMSAWVIANPDRSAMLAKSAQRIVGTLCGLAVGLVLASLGNGRPLLLLLGLACIGALGSRQRYVARYPYAWLLGAMTSVMVLVQSATSPAGLFDFAMARTADPDSATAQFYINVGDNTFLDRAKARDGAGYTVFGRVIEGMDVVDKIKAVETGVKGGMPNVPKEPVVIKSIRKAGA